MTHQSISRLFQLAIAAVILLVSTHAFAESASSKPAVDDVLLQQMIGQMVLVGFVGNKTEDEGYRILLEQAAQGKIGGVIYLGRNIRSLRAVATLNANLQSASKVPLFIAIDQEGGRIERLTKAVGFKESPSAAAIGSSMGYEDARAAYTAMAAGLAASGFNLNLGPVVDLNINPTNPIIGRLGRSYSSDARKVSVYAKAFIDGHRSNGVLTALKHFPGHGSSVADTHKGAADVSETWSDRELDPYRELIASGDARMIMSAHVINRNIPGADSTPASMSPATLVGLLRKQMKFKGVVISDDLQMGAIAKTRGLDDTIRQAVIAGNDVLVFANDKHPDPTIPERIAKVLVKEARSNPAMLERIQQSYRRITQLKAGFKTNSVGSAKPD